MAQTARSQPNPSHGPLRARSTASGDPLLTGAASSNPAKPAITAHDSAYLALSVLYVYTRTQGQTNRLELLPTSLHEIRIPVPTNGRWIAVSAPNSQHRVRIHRVQSFVSWTGRVRFHDRRQKVVMKNTTHHLRSEVNRGVSFSDRHDSVDAQCFLESTAKLCYLHLFVFNCYRHSHDRTIARSPRFDVLCVCSLLHLHGADSHCRIFNFDGMQLCIAAGGTCSATAGHASVRCVALFNNTRRLLPSVAAMARTILGFIRHAIRSRTRRNSGPNSPLSITVLTIIAAQTSFWCTTTNIPRSCSRLQNFSPLGTVTSAVFHRARAFRP